MILLLSFSVNAQQKDSFQTNTAVTKDLASKYFDLYMGLDWDKLESLMHAEISFDDPTAELAIGWQKVAGKENVIKHFKTNYGAITKMTPNLRRSFFSGDVAVFEMDFEFSFKNTKNEIVTIKMPLITILKIKDGKIIEHKDYGDYNEYLKQYRASLKSKSS